jgi:hypothetical protein
MDENNREKCSSTSSNLESKISRDEFFFFFHSMSLGNREMDTTDNEVF